MDGPIRHEPENARDRLETTRQESAAAGGRVRHAVALFELVSFVSAVSGLAALGETDELGNHRNSMPGRETF